MALLADYAITPDVFDVTSYSSEKVCGLHLQSLKEVLLTEGLVRDLRNGEWVKLFAADHRSWHRRGRELLKKLVTQGRLVRFAPALGRLPAHDRQWCDEALATHAVAPFTGGVIVTEPVKANFPGERIVARIDRLQSAPWWAARSPSVRLTRNLASYQEHLRPVLRCANSIMFIDPHVDPENRRYRDFAELVAGAGSRTPAPAIEIHRVCYEGAGLARRILRAQERRLMFESLKVPLRAAKLTVGVFIWDDFHDRYLISNLVGIQVPNGFDIDGTTTTWTRLGRSDRDDVQKEFDRATGRHALLDYFRV